MRRYGWFEFEKAPRTVKNYLSGQTLTISSGDVENPFPELECEYVDAEIRLALSIQFECELEETDRRGLVLPHLVRRDSKSKTSASVTKKTVIRLDYGRMFSSPPSYGYWRRIDDFLSDLLSCWYVIRDYPDEKFVLQIVGGWRNGAWVPTMKRTISGGLFLPEKLGKNPVAQPFLFPLDGGSSMRWYYRDMDSPAPKADLVFKRDKQSNVPYLPDTDDPVGFQGVVPYLEREDGRAFVFPSEFSLTHGREEDDRFCQSWYTYVDEDIFLSLRSSSIYRCLDLSANFRDYGFRRLPPAPDFWTVSLRGEPISWDDQRGPGNPQSRYSNLSYFVWRRVASALSEAWGAWIDPGRTIEPLSSDGFDAWWPGEAHVGDYGPTIGGGYTAGMPTDRRRVVFSNS